MSLPQAESRIPTSIGDLSITLTDYIATEEQEAKKDALFEIQVLNGDGNVMKIISGNLAPHLTQQQIQQLLAFGDWLRQKAEDEILP